jgi:hypothetical protein
MHNLRVCQDKRRVNALVSGRQHLLFETVSEVLRLEILGEFHTEALVLQDRCGKPCQCLLTRARHSNQHRVASWLHEDSQDTDDVSDSIVEEDQVHLVRVGKVVIKQLVIELLEQLASLFNNLIAFLFLVKPQNDRKEDLLAWSEYLVFLCPPDLELLVQNLDCKVLEEAQVFSSA